MLPEFYTNISLSLIQKEFPSILWGVIKWNYGATLREWEAATICDPDTLPRYITIYYT